MFRGPEPVALAGLDAVVCPPFTELRACVEAGLTTYAQNVHWDKEGAYTGEISPPRRSPTAARSSPPTQARCSRSRTWTAPSWAARPSTSTRSRRYARRPHVSPRSPRHPRRLGNRTAGTRECDRARRHAGLRPVVARLSARPAGRLGRGRRPAVGPDGQLRGGAPDYRLGPRPRPGSPADQPFDPRRLDLRERGARLRVPARARARRGRPPPRPRLVRRRPLPHRPPAGAARARPAGGDGGADLDPRLHRRPRR